MINLFKKIIKKFLVCFFAFLLEINSKVLKEQEDYILCFDCLYDKNQEQIDTFTFFEYLKKHGIKAKYVTLKDSKLKSDKYIDDVIFVGNKWEFIFKHIFLILNSKLVLTSFGLFDGLDEVLKKCNLFDYIFMEHGVTYCSFFARQIYSRQKFNKILVSTKITYEIYKKENLWLEDEMILAGLPRWDKLKSHKNNEIFIFFGWQKSIIYSKNSVSKFLDKIKNLLDELSKNIPQNIKISFAWHHEFYRRNVNLPKLNKRINLINPSEISSAINSASLLITGYSSIFWDFLYQNKPVIFYRFNLKNDWLSEDDKQIMKEINSLDDKFFNCFYKKDEVCEKLIEYIEVDFELESFNQDKISMMFFDDNFSNCESILSQIVNR